MTKLTFVKNPRWAAEVTWLVQGAATSLSLEFRGVPDHPHI